MCNVEPKVFCEPRIPHGPVGTVHIAGSVKQNASSTRCTGNVRFLTYIQHGAALNRSVLAASLARAQLRLA
jgi:hypothetical protein